MADRLLCRDLRALQVTFIRQKRVNSGCAAKSVRCTATSQKGRQNPVLQLKESLSEKSQNLQAAFREHKSKLLSTAAGIALTASLIGGNPALAADFAATGKCLFQNCQAQLAKCLIDGECVENLACLQKCNGQPDEAECQIRCGDLYENKVIQEFTACAVSNNDCVPQKVDKEAYPVPPDSALDNSFDLDNFQGRWYITAGLNPIFDIFDCQEHYFGVTEDKKLVGQIAWRIPKRGNDFIERGTIQTFRPVKGKPAKLENRGNDYLNYTDDWYILGYKPDTYAVIYYIGNNDAWEGYGGATVYSRSSTFPEEYRDEIQAVLKPVNLSIDDFRMTDNTCGPHPKITSTTDKVEDAAEEAAIEFGESIQSSVAFLGRGINKLENKTTDTAPSETAAQKEMEEGKQFIAKLRKQRSDGALKQDQIHNAQA